MVGIDMKKGFLVILFTAILMGCSRENEMDAVVEKGLSVSVEQSKRMAKSLWDQKTLLPRTLDGEGKLVTSDSKWWTSGFFPGVLWRLYEATGDTLLKHYARDYTLRVEKEQYNKGNHDVGFMLYCSFGNGYRLTGDEKYKKVLLKGAESLSTRYKDHIGLIRSWDFNKAVWQYPVIIDNMMNLELLEWASKNSGNSRMAEIARSHADLTMKNHFRPDYSCWHVVSYDTITGQPEKKHTRQGYSHESSWSRGEAWALYGYAMMYRETRQVRYLAQAKNIANYILTHPRMPDDGIPYWDYDAPDIPDAYRDASAGAIMASAFIELSTLTDGKLSQEYLAMAEKQLKTLTSPEYLAEPGTNGNFILKHSVGSLTEHSEVDVPLTYADYYYVEALLRYRDRNTVPASQLDPGVIGFDFSELTSIREGIARRDVTLEKAYHELMDEADQCLELQPEKVTDGDLPPSGDKHDFYAIGKYAWPNPKTSDGMPYIRKDCSINPEAGGFKFDLARYNNTVGRIKLLSLAYFYSQDEKYARKASQLLRVWFIDKETRMNPHFECASALPGVYKGMAIGIIFGVTLVEMTDCVKLLSLSQSWTENDDMALKQWFSDYVHWLRTSKFGIKEKKARNNHGTWYSAQIAAYSLYTGETEYVREMVEFGKQQIQEQIAPDGSLPHEMKRDWAFSYSVYGMRAFTVLAACGDRIGENLWMYKTPDGRSLEAAYLFLAPYLSGQQKWEWGVVRENEQTERVALPMMRWAAKKYHSTTLMHAVEHLQEIYDKSLKYNWI